MLAGVTAIADNCPVIPLPFTCTMTGEVGALLVIESVASRVPVALGLKTMGMTVDPLLAATEMGAAGLGRLKPGAKPKSAALVPANDNPVICKAALPVLVTVMFRVALVVFTAWSGKLSGTGEATQLALKVPPKPVNETTCGGPPLLSYTMSDAVRVPAVCGVKSMEKMNALLGERVTELRPLRENSLALTPATRKLVICTVTVPRLVKVTPSGPLLTPIAWLPKFTGAGEITQFGPAEVAVISTVLGALVSAPSKTCN